MIRVVVVLMMVVMTSMEFLITSQFSSFLLIFSRLPICFGFSGVDSFSTSSNWPTYKKGWERVDEMVALTNSIKLTKKFWDVFRWEPSLFFWYSFIHSERKSISSTQFICAVGTIHLCFLCFTWLWFTLWFSVFLRVQGCLPPKVGHGRNPAKWFSEEKLLFRVVSKLECSSRRKKGIAWKKDTPVTPLRTLTVLLWIARCKSP